MKEKIGTFEVVSGTMYACDPMYLNTPNCRGAIDNCALGTWDAYALVSDFKEYGGHRVWFLVVLHEGCQLERDPLLETIWKNELPAGFATVRKDVWVDLGMCGFFDRDLAGANLREGENVWTQENPFVEQCEKLIPEDPPCSAVLPHGAVSSSGYGDGSYWCCAHRNTEGKADAAFLRFL